MDSRAQFESWVMRINPNADLSIMVDGIDKGEYIDGYHAGLFAAWQASRAAIVVDTGYLLGDGDNGDSDYTLGFNQGITKADKAIRAAGITVKGDSQ